MNKDQQLIKHWHNSFFNNRKSMAEKEVVEFFNKMIDSIDLKNCLLKIAEDRRKHGYYGDSEEALKDYELYGDLFIYPDK